MSCRILIVEDDPLSRRNLVLFFQRAAHHVVQAESGERALDLMQQTDFHAVISDFRLHGKFNGIDVLKHQYERSAGTRLVLVTGFGSAAVQAEAEALGASYFEKPLALVDLLTRIQEGSQ